MEFSDKYIIYMEVNRKNIPLYMLKTVLKMTKQSSQKSNNSL